MQTFLPYASFEKSVRHLDARRLRKQILEGYQIVKVLMGESDGYANHPVMDMWRGYLPCLVVYVVFLCREYRRRYKKIHACRDKTVWLAIQCKIQGVYIDQVLEEFTPAEVVERVEYPWWWGKKKVHSVHRANLLRKHPRFYGKFNWPEEPTEGYYWPKAQERGKYALSPSLRDAGR